VKWQAGQAIVDFKGYSPTQVDTLTEDLLEGTLPLHVVGPAQRIGGGNRAASTWQRCDFSQ
jgi:hypothetical protein